MNKTLYDIMNDSDGCIAAFDRACADLCSTNYYLAERKISSLLQTIAKSKRLYSLIADSTRNYDFAVEFAALRKAHENGTAVFVPPLDPKKNVAFVFSLLYSIDKGKLAYKVFLDNFYKRNGGLTVEHEAFVQSAIVPFYNNFMDIYDSRFAEAEVSSTPVSNQMEVAKEQPKDKLDEFANLVVEWDEVTEAPMRLDNLALNALSSNAAEILGIVERDSLMQKKEPKARDELIRVSEMLLSFIPTQNIDDIKTLAASLKYTIMCSPYARQLEIQLADLNRYILEYGLD